MKLQSGFEERRARIEIVPLIDIIFFLLVFFIYATISMTVHYGVKVSLPVAQGDLKKGRQIIITLTQDNQLTLDGISMPQPAIVQTAAERFRNEHIPVLISGDRKAELGVGMELLGQLKTAGVTHVAFQVQDK